VRLGRRGSIGIAQNLNTRTREACGAKLAIECIAVSLVHREEEKKG